MTKMNKVDWGGITPTVDALEVNVDGPHKVGTGTTLTGDNLAALVLGPVVITDAASYTVLAANSGRLHVVPDLTADCTITMPAAAVGLKYKFVYGGATADAQDWIIQVPSGFYIGGGLHVDSDAGAGADECVPVFSDGNSNDFCRVLTPQGGTFVEIECDGTNWYVNAIVVSASASALAFADT
jgi:hypothetical protein